MKKNLLFILVFVNLSAKDVKYTNYLKEDKQESYNYGISSDQIDIPKINPNNIGAKRLFLIFGCSVIFYFAYKAINGKKRKKVIKHDLQDLDYTQKS